MKQVGIVVIGRNEGERLKRCLGSIPENVGQIVYVDSGSSDGSVEYARSIGVDVVDLDMRIPFSAGRARNEGFRKIISDNPEIQYIQFVDGDCELVEGWIDTSIEYMDRHQDCAIVFGRRKERYPQASIYNRLCDMEWDGPIGDAKSCGGDFFARKDPLLDVDGFNPTVVAGEEPELCFRLRKLQWRIYRLDHLMTLHDAAIKKFSQWWKRMVRSGHAYAQGFMLHGLGDEKYCFRDSMRIWIWGVLLPFCGVLFSVLIHFSFLLIFVLYPVQIVRITRHINKQTDQWHHSLLYAVFTIIGKLPQTVGQLLFLKRKILGNRYSIIEYN